MTYEYICRKCDTIIPVKHGMNEKPTITCKCGEVRRRYLSKAPSAHNVNGGNKKG